MINKIINFEDFKNEIIKIGYFHAPIYDLGGISTKRDSCSNCKKEKDVFILLSKSNNQVHPLCINCIETTKLIFSHDTDFGLVHPNIPEFMQEEDAKNKVKSSRYSSLLSTPNYFTLQGERWKTHCSDFMIYKGTWEAYDFTEKSLNGNGKQLFLEMTDEYPTLWDDFDLDINEKKNTWDDCLYHVFECTQCSIKKGYWEH